MATRELKCSCSSTFQDKEYGQGIRLCNDNEKDGTRCTVCNSIHKTEKSPSRKK